MTRDKLTKRHRSHAPPDARCDATDRSAIGRHLVDRLVVRRAARLPGDAGPRGLVRAGALVLPCALGRTGILRGKREGDRGTPAGRMRLVEGSYRPDRLARPRCRVPLRPMRRDDGWCDDPASAAYNRAGRLPIAASHEAMWRADGLYDVVFVLDWNLAPRRAGRGSAIFLHCAKWSGQEAGTGFAARLKPTLGCVALRPGDMRRLLPRLKRRVELLVV